MKRIAAFGLAAVGGLNTIFIIISMATSAWLSGTGFGFGLWDNNAIGDLRSRFDVIRAFMFLALFVQIAAVVLCVLMGLQKTQKKIMAVIMFLVSGVFLLIALSIFTALVNTFYASVRVIPYGSSYILGWVAFVFSIILAVAVEVLSRVSFAQQ